VKSLYGLTTAPRLWFQHLFDALLSLGFIQCFFEPCMLIRRNLMIIIYVDDAGISAKHECDIDHLIEDLTGLGFELKKEGSFVEFLGIKFTRHTDGSVELTQKELTEKILRATNMMDCNPNRTPAREQGLGDDPDGAPMAESWSYPSIVGMMIYLSTNTRPDIAFAVSQVARFNRQPKQSHATALKMIIRYLKGTVDKGIIMHPSKALSLAMYVDADFAGLYGVESPRSPISARSRTGFVLFLADCPLYWKSFLQSKTAHSTLEAEYCALSSSLRTMLPLRSLLLEILNRLELPNDWSASVHAKVFEDNQGALLLAVNHRLTNRTKYFHIDWHFFWDYQRLDYFSCHPVDTKLQCGNYLTKGLPCVPFEAERYLSQRF
jgi:Reverse transcriptase (RNA-dependent DNA polymerase)